MAMLPACENNAPVATSKNTSLYPQPLIPPALDSISDITAKLMTTLQETFHDPYHPATV
jgi:hypothetical protein